MGMKRISIFFSMALAATALIGCRKEATEQQAPPPPVVTIAPVERQEIIEWNEFTGRTEAVERVDLRPRVSGHVQEVKFQSGQLVKKGDVLFVIDPRWHQAEFNRREAEYIQAEVRVTSAEREAKRTEQLLTNRAISTEEAEQRESRFQEAKASLLAAEAARDTAKLDLEYTQVRAPITGRVSRALITEGNYVSGIPAAAAVLTTIVSVDPIYVYADVDENFLLKFNTLNRANQIASNGKGEIPVELQLADADTFTNHGYVESFDNRLDANTGSILLRAVFPNPNGEIVPGLFARIRIPGSAKYTALLVDERSIGTDQVQKFVLALTPTNTVEYRAVKLGPTIDGKRVIRSGLEADDQIVANIVQQRVRPGMPIVPQEATAEAPKTDSQTAKK
ncbi:MAG: efflux RND transporter periplasmic adaptor subunit [Verrucomicrobia bacterium]|nr:efflux RND transporter periplasmic adaptor subunit [Verrucomicrobiota bacterium]